MSQKLNPRTTDDSLHAKLAAAHESAVMLNMNTDLILLCVKEMDGANLAKFITNIFEGYGVWFANIAGVSGEYAALRDHPFRSGRNAFASAHISVTGTSAHMVALVCFGTDPELDVTDLIENLRTGNNPFAGMKSEVIIQNIDRIRDRFAAHATLWPDPNEVAAALEIEWAKVARLYPAPKESTKAVVASREENTCAEVSKVMTGELVNAGISEVSFNIKAQGSVEQTMDEIWHIGNHCVATIWPDAEEITITLTKPGTLENESANPTDNVSPLGGATEISTSPLNAVQPPALMSAVDLAGFLGIPDKKSAVDSFLRRHREKALDCFEMVESPRRNEAKFLYRSDDVLPFLKKHFLVNERRTK